MRLGLNRASPAETMRRSSIVCQATALLLMGAMGAPALAQAPTLQERKAWMRRLLDLQQERLEQRRRYVESAATVPALENCGGWGWHHGGGMGPGPGPGMGW
jgi:hypothetical protein